MKRRDQLECSSWLLFAALLAGAVQITETSATWAQDAPARRAQPGDVDLKLSRVFMLVGKTGLGHEHGVVGTLKSGSIVLGRETNAGQLVFDMSTLDADGPEARKYVGLKGETDAGTRRQVNENMLGAGVLNTVKFPTATFQIDSAASLPPKPGAKNVWYLLKGTFTLAGVSRPLTLRCEVTPVRNQWKVHTEFVLAQTDYGIKPFSKAFGAIGVADEMKVYGDVFIVGSER